ncbi:coth protein-domain-containing protein [Phycomyces nitens]|nr:coth protein-domain-containing protein [Phycomyces nitens]
MKYSLSIIALSMIACSEAANVLFKVIAPDAKGAVSVSINGATTALQTADADVPFYTGTVDLPDNASYKYIVDGTAESFDRSLESGRSATRNDFYDRPVTYANIPELPYPIKDNNWDRETQDSPMWDSNYIPSIFITGIQSEMDNLVENVPKGDVVYKTKFTFIGPDDVFTFKDCDFGLHHGGRKKNTAKQSWEWTLPSGEYLYDRDWIKIRHMEEDPTQIREKLYADVLHSMGTYANRANMVRFFINKESFGTFNMLDDTPMYSYIRSMFYGGNPPAEMGPLFDGATGADFQVHTDDVGYSAWEPSPQTTATSDDIAPLAIALANTTMTDDAQVAKFTSFFNTDQFLRFMVMEYLTADWDGYWMFQSNCGAYLDTEANMWYYLGQDYDGTFGVNLDVPEGRDFIKVKYEDYATRYPNSVMINRLLENPKMKATFETYLKETVGSVFNNETLTSRVLAYHDFILPDLKWDRSIKQRSPGINYGWTFEQTAENLWSGVTGPLGNGGGAGWGLIEYIAAKAQVVSELYGTEANSTPSGVTPAAGPTSSAAAAPASSSAAAAAPTSPVVVPSPEAPNTPQSSSSVESSTPGTDSKTTQKLDFMAAVKETSFANTLLPIRSLAILGSFLVLFI